MESSIRVHESGSGALSDIEETIETVESTLVVAAPGDTLPRFEPALRRVGARDVLVLLLVGDADGSGTEVPAGIDGIVRVLQEPVPALGVVDQRAGWAGASSLLRRGRVPDRTISVVENRDVVQMLFAGFQGTYWEQGIERQVRDRKQFPATYDLFQDAVVDATLALREGVDVAATAVGRWAGTDDPVIVEGRVVTSRQSYVHPITTTIPGQNGLVVEREDGTAATLGGEGAFREDVEVSELTLRRAE